MSEEESILDLVNKKAESLKKGNSKEKQNELKIDTKLLLEESPPVIGTRIELFNMISQDIAEYEVEDKVIKDSKDKDDDKDKKGTQ